MKKYNLVQGLNWIGINEIYKMIDNLNNNVVEGLSFFNVKVDEVEVVEKDEQYILFCGIFKVTLRISQFEVSLYCPELIEKHEDVMLHNAPSKHIIMFKKIKFSNMNKEELNFVKTYLQFLKAVAEVKFSTSLFLNGKTYDSKVSLGKRFTLKIGNDNSVILNTKMIQGRSK